MPDSRIIAGPLFLFGVPCLCIFLAARSRKKNEGKPFLGWALFVIGSLMVALTAFTHVTTMLALQEHADVDLLCGFLVWFIPSLVMMLSGWAIRKGTGLTRPTRTNSPSSMSADERVGKNARRDS